MLKASAPLIERDIELASERLKLEKERGELEQEKAEFKRERGERTRTLKRELEEESNTAIADFIKLNPSLRKAFPLILSSKLEEIIPVKRVRT